MSGLHQQRLQKLVQHASAAGLDAVAVMPGPNLVYLADLHAHLSERPTLAIIPTRGTPALILPAFEAGKAKASPLNAELFTYDDSNGPSDAFSKALSALNLSGRRLGVEARRIRFLELDLLARSSHTPKPEACDAVFARLRMCKDAAELALMRKAIAIAETALQKTLPSVRAGVSEKTIAAEITLQILRSGADVELPFAPIVACGANGANPHATPGEKLFQPGELLTIDWGAFHNGYASDLTRTYAISGAEVPAELRRAYEAVKAANAAGRAAARPGGTGQEVDRAARKVIVDAGFGQYFTHRTGHGLGLETHEEPDMKEGSLIPLEPGMTFTVEPGIYIPNLGGIRIEDDVVITAAGAETLTSLPRDLQVLLG